MAAVIAPAHGIRFMTHRDLVAVLRIERRAYEYGWNEAIFRDCLRVGYCCLVGEERREITSYGVMSASAGESHILNLCVSPNHFRRGFGRAMLERLLDRAIEQGAQTAFLEVRPTNPAAIELYLAAGFTEIGERRGYYPAARGRENALVMGKELLSQDAKENGVY